jgi:hypothetical protein
VSLLTPCCVPAYWTIEYFTPAAFSAASYAGQAALMRSSVPASCTSSGAFTLAACSGAGVLP